MCPKQYTLTPKDIYRYAAGVLEPHLRNVWVQSLALFFDPAPRWLQAQLVQAAL